ncbi:MAG: hypothetical protein ACOYK8_07655 [Alphaproteobacteria bacterium]
MAEAADFPLLRIDQAIKIVEKNQKTKLHSGGFAAFLDQFLQNKPDDYAFSVEEAKKLLEVVDQLGAVPAVSAVVNNMSLQNGVLTQKFNALLALTGRPKNNIAEVEGYDGKKAVICSAPFADITIEQSSNADDYNSITVVPKTEDSEKAAAITAAALQIQELFNKEAAAVVPPFELLAQQNLQPVRDFVRGTGREDLSHILYNLSQPNLREISLELYGQQSLATGSMQQIRGKLQELKDVGLLDNEQTLLATGLLTTDLPPEQTTARPGFRIFGW